MVRFPNSKINLGLRVMEKRPDGYHALQTVFYPVSLRDALELNISTDPHFKLELYGIPLPGDLSTNLCFKAWQLLQNDFPEIPPLHMHLIKAIPAGAGLGGGSSDGACTLQLINQQFRLGLAEEQLHAYALQLGSDCPFFILNKPCYATGRGEQLQCIDLNLSEYYFVLVDAGVHISTAWAFEKIKLSSFSGSVQETVTQSVTSWKTTLSNDFELPVFEAYPFLKTIKEELYIAGAVYASMTGTGSCIYGLFHNTTSAALTSLSRRHKVYNLKNNR